MTIVIIVIMAVSDLIRQDNGWCYVYSVGLVDGKRMFAVFLREFKSFLSVDVTLGMAGIFHKIRTIRLLSAIKQRQGPNE